MFACGARGCFWTMTSRRPAASLRIATCESQTIPIALALTLPLPRDVSTTAVMGAVSLVCCSTDMCLACRLADRSGIGRACRADCEHDMGLSSSDMTDLQNTWAQMMNLTQAKVLEKGGFDWRM